MEYILWNDGLRKKRGRSNGTLPQNMKMSDPSPPDVIGEAKRNDSKKVFLGLLGNGLSFFHKKVIWETVHLTVLHFLKVIQKFNQNFVKKLPEHRDTFSC